MTDSVGGTDLSTGVGTERNITIITGLVLTLVPIREAQPRYPQRAPRSTFGEAHTQAGRVADLCGFGGAA